MKINRFPQRLGVVVAVIGFVLLIAALITTVVTPNNVITLYLFLGCLGSFVLIIVGMLFLMIFSVLRDAWTGDNEGMDSSIGS